jgi:hypothetical protein
MRRRRQKTIVKSAEEDNNGMSSLNKISTDQLGNRVVVTGEWESVTQPTPTPFYTAGFWTDI